MKLRKRGGALCGACAEETPEKRALTLGLGADSPGPAAPSPPSPQPAAAASRKPSPAPPAAAGSPCLQGAGGKTGGVPRSPHPGCQATRFWLWPALWPKAYLEKLPL